MDASLLVAMLAMTAVVAAYVRQGVMSLRGVYSHGDEARSRSRTEMRVHVAIRRARRRCEPAPWEQPRG
jgi:hypothetical protein